MDGDGKSTAARFIFRDEAGHVFPPQAKRLAPDFYFQPQIYRRDGDMVCCRRVALQCNTIAARNIGNFARGYYSTALVGRDRGEAGTLDQSDGLRLLQR